MRKRKFNRRMTRLSHAHDPLQFSSNKLLKVIDRVTHWYSYQFIDQISALASESAKNNCSYLYSLSSVYSVASYLKQYLKFRDST